MYSNYKNMQEIWKDIVGYEGLYQVSNLGRVRSLDRIIEGSVKDYSYKSKILKPGKMTTGYLFVNLYKDKKSSSKRIHKLVATAFLDHVSSGYNSIVDHIDNDKTNNVVTNLQITTARVNTSKDKKDKTSQYTGVIWHKFSKKWTASIRIGKSRKYLGYFVNEEDAHLAYQKELTLLNN